MYIDKTQVNKILMITLSNIGDVVLTLPVLGILRREFPKAHITVMSGANAKELLEAEGAISDLILYDKHRSFLKNIKLALTLRRRKFDLVVDLRNSMFPLLIGARYNTSLFKNKDSDTHRIDKHLSRLYPLGISVSNPPFPISFTRDDKLHVHSVLNELGLLTEDNMVAIAAGAKSHIKRWTVTGFVELCARLSKEMGVKILLLGDENDKSINEDIYAAGIKDVYDLSGKTSLRELAYLLSLCKLLVTNDSAPLHIAGALGLPVVAIFGPTSHKKYGPILPDSKVVRSKVRCSPCEKAKCRFGLECMNNVLADEVFSAARDILLKN